MTTPFRIVQDAKLTTLGRIVLILLATWAFTVTMPDWYRVFHPQGMGSLGFSADNDGNISLNPDLTGATAKAAGLRDGDRIDLRAMRCFADGRLTARCADTLAVFGGMGGLQYVLAGQRIRLCIVRPSGERVPPGSTRVPLCPASSKALTVQATDPRTSAWNRLWLGADEIAAMLFIVLAFYLVWSRPTVMTWGFFLYAIWFNPGQYFVFYAWLRQWPSAELIQEATQSIAQAFGYAGFVRFALRFPTDEPAPLWQRVRRWALPLFIAVLAALQLASFANAFGVPTERVTDISYVAGYLVDAYVVYALWRRSRKQSPVDRQRTRWVTAGCLIGLTTFVFADSNEATSLWTGLWQQTYWGHDLWGAIWQRQGGPSETVLAFLFLGNMTLVAAVVHAIVRHRVIDVNFAVSRGAVLLALSGFYFAILSIVHSLTAHYVENAFEGGGFAVTTACTALLTLSFEKAREIMNEVSDHLFFRQLHEAEESLALASKAFLECTSLTEIERLLVDAPVGALSLASAAVFREEQARFVRHAAGYGWDARTIGDLDQMPTIVPQLKAARGPVRLSGTIWGDAGVPGDAGLPVLAVPVSGPLGFFAVVLYGGHRTGDDLNADERRMLGGFGTSAAAAYEHVEATAVAEENRRLKAQLSASSRQPALLQTSDGARHKHERVAADPVHPTS